MVVWCHECIIFWCHLTEKNILYIVNGAWLNIIFSFEDLTSKIKLIPLFLLKNSQFFYKIQLNSNFNLGVLENKCLFFVLWSFICCCENTEFNKKKYAAIFLLFEQAKEKKKDKISLKNICRLRIYWLFGCHKCIKNSELGNCIGSLWNHVVNSSIIVESECPIN